MAVLVPVAVNAQSANSNQKPSIVDQLATRFHLNKADVQKVFDENQASRQAMHMQNEQTRLAALVKAGTLTQAQADKITAKLAEMQTERETDRTEMKSLTPAERHDKREVERTALQKWATDNGIDIKYLMPGHGDMGRHGMMDD